MKVTNEMESDKNRCYTCINCGSSAKDLYKKYSPTVLKLAKCENCSYIVDKYIEYDTIIILIDLILINREAYRHVLFNSSFSHWKLFIIIQLMEAYSDWMLVSHPYYIPDLDSKKPVDLDNFSTGDLDYYRTVLKVLCRNFCFYVSISLLTVLYNKLMKSLDTYKEAFQKIWKCTSLSSFGIFLFLPSLIWNMSLLYEYHFMCVCLYTSLSQLVAYTVMCRCPKIWSIIVIIIAYFCKISINNFLTGNSITAI